MSVWHCRSCPAARFSRPWRSYDRLSRDRFLEKYGFDRHWRNARTHASHDPVDWKYHHVGNFRLNHVLPPNHGQL